MSENRFSELLAERESPAPTAGFLVIPAPVAELGQASPMQWLYQKLYEQAAQASQPVPVRDLFAVMN